MSHTAIISEIKITDIAALRSAILDLNKMGIRAELRENVAPRAYYENQNGMGVAPYVLHIADAQYDVGFYPDQANKEYEARTDFFGGSVEKVLGVRDGTEQGRMGKLFNAYVANATINQAIRKGYKYRRIYDKQTGLTESVVLAA
jgi:hypothetical protein